MVAPGDAGLGSDPAALVRCGDDPAELDLGDFLDRGRDQAAVADQLAILAEDDRAAADPGLLVAGDVPLDPIPSAGPVEWVAPVDQRLGIAEERAHRVEVARRERPQGQPLGLDRRRSGAVGHRLKLAGSAWCEA